MTTQISSPCITTTDICNGSYGCGTDTEMAVLARVVPVWEKDEWSNGKAYGPLSVVRAPGTDTLYISKVPVPCGIELGDPKYWSVYNDNKVASEAKEIAEEARAEAAGAVSAADAASRAVVAEAEARENADSAITTELNAKIMQEQEARETADTTINEEVSRLSSNSDALSARVDNLEQNGGGGIASLEARLTAAETINTQQGTEIESLQTQLSTANDDINSMGERVGTNSNKIIELRQDYASTDQTANQASMGVDELRTSTARLETELRQLIVPNPDTQQFEKGPKMEEWTSVGGGGITINETIVERSYVSASSNSFTLTETLEKFDIENVKFLGVTFSFEVPGIKQKFRINTFSSEGSWSPGQKTIYACANTIVDMQGESFKNVVGNPLSFPIGIAFYSDDSNFSKVFNWQGRIMFTPGNLNNSLNFKMQPIMSFIGTPNLNSILQIYFDGSVTCKIRIKYIS